MKPIVYINGEYVYYKKAKIDINDRGYFFGDGVYEVVIYQNGRYISMEQHLERLVYSMRTIEIEERYIPYIINEINIVSNELIIRNDIESARFYFQVTRGISERDHIFPHTDVRPVLLAFMQDVTIHIPPTDGICCVTVPDIRWERCDIKTISLLGNILSKQKANIIGYDEVIFFDGNNIVTECGSRNIFIVDNNGTIITHPEGNQILSGVTRASVIEIAKGLGFFVEEKKFSVDEMYNAKEVFTTTSSHFVTPVIKIDDKDISNTIAGYITRTIEMEYYNSYLSV